ncbi:phage antirepressor KilAC domain-containing protein [Kosakonia sacchari]|uniref:phage antirepressor KilAC domain-containing protein n=1 Tax=Kosakonia sacchari TaxID=1158459 RepID=UPI002ACD3747|nr:phage antirepressor KilAC domain-containing protein [Kosakonia sacchari]MDZ7323391.1 phage antirepressor KilAC domain-containing protein [Kosakonia sacchari]
MVIPGENFNSQQALATVSSREIAKLTGLTHTEVKRMVKSLETAQRLSQPVNEHMYEREGEMRQEFLLNKRDSLLTVSRLSPGFTAEMLDRWQEKEKDISLPDFTNPAAAARAWAEQYEKRQRAEALLAVSAPKAEFFDRYVRVEESLGFRQLCKMLRVKESLFRSFLLERNIMQRVDGALMPPQYHIDAGYFTVHGGVGENKRSWSQARFTARGVKWVADLWAKQLSSLPVEMPRAERTESKAPERSWF